MKITEIIAGTPASICYPHDSRAAVVVRRTPKRIVIKRVEVGENVRVDGGTGDTPPIVEAQGILDQPIDGTEMTLTLRERADGSVYATNGDGWKVSLGHSVSRTNYQNW